VLLVLLTPGLEVFEPTRVFELLSELKEQLLRREEVPRRIDRGLYSMKVVLLFAKVVLPNNCFSY